MLRGGVAVSSRVARGLERVAPGLAARLLRRDVRGAMGTRVVGGGPVTAIEAVEDAEHALVSAANPTRATTNASKMKITGNGTTTKVEGMAVTEAKAATAAEAHAAEELIMAEMIILKRM